MVCFYCISNCIFGVFVCEWKADVCAVCIRIQKSTKISIELNNVPEEHCTCNRIQIRAKMMKAMHANTADVFQTNKKPWGIEKKQQQQTRMSEWWMASWQVLLVPFVFYWMSDRLKISRLTKTHTNIWIIAHMPLLEMITTGLINRCLNSEKVGKSHRVTCGKHFWGIHISPPPSVASPTLLIQSGWFIGTSKAGSLLLQVQLLSENTFESPYPRRVRGKLFDCSANIFFLCDMLSKH